MPSKDKRPVKVPKGNVLIEFTNDVKGNVKKGSRVITDKAKADLLAKLKRAKIVKEYSEGEVLKLAKAGKDYLNPGK